MLSFRSILLAAAAFATAASAIPTPDTAARALVTTVGATIGGGGVANGVTGGISGRGEEPNCQYAPDVFKKCHDSVVDIIVEIKDTVNCEGGYEKALEELGLIIKGELFLNGVVCTVKELAGIVGGLIIIIVEVIYLVMKALGFHDVTLCGVLVEIGVLLCELLKLVLGLVEGLLVEIVAIIVPYKEHCHFIHFDALLALLQIVL